MTETALSIEQFLQTIRPWLEQEVDARILVEPELKDRLVLMRHREQIIRTYVEATRRRCLEARVAKLEQRLRPRIVR
jgi:hypothetical protein